MYPRSAEGIDRLKLWQSENSGASATQIEDELRSIQTFAALKPAYKILIFIAGNFDGTTLTALNSNVTTQTTIMKAMSKTPAQQRQLIAAFEWFFGTLKADLAKFFPAILKKLFEEDIVEEDVFLDWYQDSLRNDDTIPLVDDDVLESLKTSARPFYEWLQDAEDDSSEDGDAEEDD